MPWYCANSAWASRPGSVPARSTPAAAASWHAFARWRSILPSTPASYFHLLRWQALSGRQKPLVVFTPKSLLRLKAAVSKTAEFTSGTLAPVLGDHEATDQAAVRRVLLCTGKVYYDLYEAREAAGIDDVYLLRIEQLYPFPAKALVTELSRFPKAEIFWAQEEPHNMGALLFMTYRLKRNIQALGGTIQLFAVSRDESPAPSPGSHTVFNKTHKRLLEEAFGDFTNITTVD